MYIYIFLPKTDHGAIFPPRPSYSSERILVQASGIGITAVGGYKALKTKILVIRS